MNIENRGFTLTNVPKPKTKYDTLKTKPLAIKENNNRYLIRVRQNPRDKKEKPLVLSFAGSIFRRQDIELIQWWLEEFIMLKIENHPLTDLHNAALNALANDCPRQFEQINSAYDLIEDNAQTMGELFSRFRSDYLSRREQDRDPNYKGNVAPVVTIDSRIEWVLARIPSDFDPLKVNGKYLGRLFTKIMEEERNSLGNPYSLSTLATYWSFIISVYSRATAATVPWLRYNPIQGLKRNSMPSYELHLRQKKRKKLEVVKLSDDERGYLIQACGDCECLQALVFYLLHKPCRISEPKDMQWKDIVIEQGTEEIKVNCKVDKKSIEVYRQWVPVVGEWKKYLFAWKFQQRKRGSVKPTDRVWSKYSDSHLPWNRAVRELIQTRIRWWNRDNPTKQIPIYKNIGNVIRSNALYYLVDTMKLSWRDAATIGGTSVDMLERHYLTDRNAAIETATESFEIKYQQAKVGDKIRRSELLDEKEQRGFDALVPSRHHLEVLEEITQEAEELAEERKNDG